MNATWARDVAAEIERIRSVEQSALDTYQQLVDARARLEGALLFHRMDHGEISFASFMMAVMGRG